MKKAPDQNMIGADTALTQAADFDRPTINRRNPNAKNGSPCTWQGQWNFGTWVNSASAPTDDKMGQDKLLKFRRMSAPPNHRNTQ